MLEELGEDQVASETITIGLDRSAIEDSSCWSISGDFNSAPDFIDGAIDGPVEDHHARCWAGISDQALDPCSSLLQFPVGCDGV
jgi:hypothetical protein